MREATALRIDDFPCVVVNGILYRYTDDQWKRGAVTISTQDEVLLLLALFNQQAAQFPAWSEAPDE